MSKLWMKNLFHDAELFSEHKISIEELRSFGESILLESDRGVILCFISFIDLVLKQQLIATFSHKEKKSFDRIFGQNGPLATLSQKIELSYAMGLISKYIYDNINSFTRIRNDLGHDWSVFSIESCDFNKMFGKIPAVIQAKKMFKEMEQHLPNKDCKLIVSNRDSVDYAILTTIIGANSHYSEMKHSETDESLR